MKDPLKKLVAVLTCIIAMMFVAIIVLATQKPVQEDFNTLERLQKLQKLEKSIDSLSKNVHILIEERRMYKRKYDSLSNIPQQITKKYDNIYKNIDKSNSTTLLNAFDSLFANGIGKQ